MNNIVELNIAELETVNGAGPVGDGLQSVSDAAAGVAATSKNAKVRLAAGAVSLGAGILAGVADHFGV